MPPPPERRKKRPYHRVRHKKSPRTTKPGEHVPVLLPEVLATLNLQPGQVVVDCTLGYAGHSVELLKCVGPTGRLIATDLDAGYLAEAEALLAAVGHPYLVKHSNFAGLANILAAESIMGVDGVLADLGMSSMQVDDRDRGFSYMRDGPLDMRMDRTRGKTAAELLNEIPLEDLITALRDLGDEPEAEKIANAIFNHRVEKPFARTTELRDLIELAAPVTVILGPGRFPARKQRLLPTTRVFQTLRILVNRELANLQQLLRLLPHLLNPGGTAAIISFHSGEDRIVKAAFRTGLRDGTYEAASEDAIRPTADEKLANPRARSAKLRWARKPKE